MLHTGKVLNSHSQNLLSLKCTFFEAINFYQLSKELQYLGNKYSNSQQFPTNKFFLPKQPTTSTAHQSVSTTMT